MTKIFLDSGDPKETKVALKLLGTLDGQTTNPSLFAKNPAVAGKKFTQKEIYQEYKKIVIEISQLIPQGSISIEVYADHKTEAQEIITKALEMNTWIPNARIKLPINQAGLKAAEFLVKQGVKINMTLCFTQEQAAAVYLATQGAKKGDVFLSPFIGRLDDIGINGLDLIKNCVKMFKNSDGHVEVLAASIRNLGHLLGSIYIGADIVTAPLSVYQEWRKFKEINYQEINLNQPWEKINIQHDLTKTGIDRFCADWNNLVEPEGFEPSTSSM